MLKFLKGKESIPQKNSNDLEKKKDRNYKIPVCLTCRVSFVISLGRQQAYRPFCLPFWKNRIRWQRWIKSISVLRYNFCFSLQPGVSHKLTKGNVVAKAKPLPSEKKI